MAMTKKPQNARRRRLPTHNAFNVNNKLAIFIAMVKVVNATYNVWEMKLSLRPLPTTFIYLLPRPRIKKIPEANLSKLSVNQIVLQMHKGVYGFH